MIQLAFIFWDPKPELFTVPWLNLPILWYGCFFAAGFILGFPVFVGVLQRFFSVGCPSADPVDLRRQASRLTDRLMVYVGVATILGARIGHYLFYENPSEYLQHPLELFNLWRMRGLASHGAAIGIVLGLGLFVRRYRDSLRGVSWLQLLDFVCVPTALAGALIRVGNFFNQEILGRASSTLPWAVLFGHPADGSFPFPRHPVQLYEAVAYMLIFFVLWRWSYRPTFLLIQGRLLGWFLVLVFGARLLVEHWKEEQSHLMPELFSLNMGQLLSIPAVLIGLFFIARPQLKQPDLP